MEENAKSRKGEEPQFEPCTSPHILTGLSRGKHKFEVRAIDSDGDPDISPAIFKWKIVRN